MSNPPEFKRVLSLFDATCVVIGTIVGVGIFFTPSSIAELAGSGWLAMTAWAVGGLIALCGAFVFAELGGLYPKTAGQYDILRDCYSSLPAFMFVFCMATVILPGSSAIIAIICAQNVFIAVTGGMPGLDAIIAPAAFLIVALAVINAFGVKWGAGIQNFTVITKLAALVFIVVVAVLAGTESVSGPVESVESAPKGWGIGHALFAALIPAMFTYGGWQQVLWVGGEIRNPSKNLARSICIGVLIVVVIYMIANWAYLRLLGPTGVANGGALAAEAVAAGWPTIGSRIVAGAVAISAFGVLNAQFLAGPRLTQGMAADGRFFEVFRSIHATTSTPVPAIILLAFMSLALLGVASIFGQDPIDQLLTGVVFIDCIFFMLTGLAVILLRRSKRDAERPFKVPLYPLTPLIFVVGEFAIVIGAYGDPNTRKAAYIGVVWLLVSAVIWSWFHVRGRERMAG